MKRKFIVTPTGDTKEFHHLLPRFRHNHREYSGLMPITDEHGRIITPARVRIAA